MGICVTGHRGMEKNTRQIWRLATDLRWSEKCSERRFAAYVERLSQAFGLGALSGIGLLRSGQSVTSGAANHGMSTTFDEA